MTRCYNCSRPATTETERLVAPPLSAKRKPILVTVPCCPSCIGVEVTT